METRQDYILDMIRRAGEALAAFLQLAVRPDLRADDEHDLDRDLDDVFAGLDAHAHRLDPETLRGVLRRRDRALLFAILQARKGLRRLAVGADDDALARLRGAHALLDRLAGEPVAADDPTGAALVDAARPLADALADVLAERAP